MALKFAMLLELVDRASAPARRARASVQQLTASARRMAGSIRQQKRDIESGARSLEHYERRARRLRSVALGRTFQAAAASARRLAGNLRDLPRRLQLVERAGRAAGSGLKWLGGKAMAGLQVAGAAGLAAGGFALFDLFRTAGQFEQYQIMLEGIEGSATKAQKAMRWVQAFAEKTPYELSEVMEAFVSLKAYGIDPTNGSLLALGDAASGMSKPISQAVEAMADAMTGEFERLKEFGIRASKEGDRVTFTWRQNGKDMRREAAMTGGAIEQALTGIFSERFGGGMARQARTLFGILSNIKDLWSKFLLMVADAGIFDKVKDRLDQLRARIDAMAKNGQLQKWAERVSHWLEKAWDWGVKFVTETNWSQVGQDMKTIAEAALIIAKAIIDAAGAMDRFQRAMPLGNISMLRNIMGLSGDNPTAPQAPAAPARRAPARTADPQARSREEWNRLLGPSRPLPARQRGTSLGQPQKVKVDGRAEVKVSLSPDLTGRLAKLERGQSDIAQTITVGRTMRGGA